MLLLYTVYIRNGRNESLHHRVHSFFFPPFFTLSLAHAFVTIKLNTLKCLDFPYLLSLPNVTSAKIHYRDSIVNQRLLLNHQHWNDCSVVFIIGFCTFHAYYCSGFDSVMNLLFKSLLTPENFYFWFHSSDSESNVQCATLGYLICWLIIIFSNGTNWKISMSLSASIFTRHFLLDYQNINVITMGFLMYV